MLLTPIMLVIVEAPLVSVFKHLIKSYRSTKNKLLIPFVIIVSAAILLLLVGAVLLEWSIFDYM